MVKCLICLNELSPRTLAENQVKVEKAGGLDTVLKAFKAHKEDKTKLPELVLGVLKCLKENPERSATIKKMLSEDPEFKELYSKLYYSGVFNLWGTLW